MDLQRFVSAQAPTYRRALEELRAGCKRSHWMWFVFPQIDGLGRSATAKQFAIRSAEEARRYLAHPLLGPRLKECVAALLATEGRSANEILGHPDDLKLRSSMTLFEAVDEGDGDFSAVLEKYFQGHRDQRTLKLLADSP